MTPKDLNEIILKEFPEIKKEFDDYVSWQEGLETGSFLVVEDVFMEYIYSEIEKSNEELMKRFVSFIERVYLLGDEYATNVITIGVLENAKCSAFSEIIYDNLLPETKKMFDELEV